MNEETTKLNLVENPIDNSTDLTIQNPRKRRIGKKEPPLSKKKRAEPNAAKPEYFFTNELRKVKPYYFIYQTYAKERWINMTIYGLFEKEFNDRLPSHYLNCIKKGLITVNGCQVSPDYIIKNSDLIENRIHRHEPPVLASSIEIVQQTDDLLVISKPSSLPVHPTGRYRHLTAINILKYEMGFEELHAVNRIDRLTSGLVLLALNKSKASTMMKQMQDRAVEKSYLARVKGKFPFDRIECNEPIKTASHKVGVNIVSSDGKPSSTVFTFISFNGITSLVKCEPKTGRTHQIRVHLQYLGFPIANDPLYCSSAWDDSLKDGAISQEVCKDVINRVTNQVFADEKPVDEEFEGCEGCLNERMDPTPEQLSIWLHALTYKSKDWQYETKYPSWAEDGWDGDKELEERFWKHGGLWDGIAPGTLTSS
ncbi:pseudouridine synthase [Globomyces pollinis-pini]|nr:pseudouridine synthase [Globomyces pollinis-pini]